MQIPAIIRRTSRLIAVASIAALAVVMASSRGYVFSPKEKGAYAEANTISFVRPGLNLKLNSASITSAGVISANLSITDKAGLALDRLGVQTPGTVSVSCVAAYIPQGQKQYVAYTTRVQNSPITNRSATQAGTDTGGTWSGPATDGSYTYTFGVKAPTNFDQTVTHTVGCQASRSLTEWNLGTNYATALFTWVPNGSKVTVTRDVVRNASCNKCHEDLAFHGGSRRGLDYCVLCHTPQTTDPDTGNTVDMVVMTHKIHMGAMLPSVQKGGKYQIIGFNQSVSDWSGVGLPTDPGNCQLCHEQNTGAAQAKAYLTPSRTACGACHDDVNFITGTGHVNMPQVSDNSCANCHIPQGEAPLDASILGAHITRTNGGAINPGMEPYVPGMVFSNLVVKNGTAGSKPTITFKMVDNAGKAIDLASLKTTPNRIAAVLAGPTSEYGYTNFGSDVTTGGYVSEDVTTTGSCDASGNCQYTFTHAIPAGSKGTYAIGLEGRRGLTLMPGTQAAVSTEYGAKNVVAYFAVDGSTVAPRRTVVAIDKCNKCHTYLSLHGTNRNQIEMCVLCHNPSETDQARRPVAVNATDKATPAQSVQFAYMIHRIHTGEQLNEMGAGYTVVGFGGSHNDFSEVRYPVFSPSGAPGDLRSCDMCHVNGSEGNLPLGKGAVKIPQGIVNPLGAVTAACTGCHAGTDALAHAVQNTVMLGTQSVEACTACHSASGEFSAARVHAQ